MKKIAIYILSISLLVSANVKPAEALILDPAALAAKISDWVGKINDAVSKVTQQISQVKQMAAQGFNKEALFGKLSDFLGKYAEEKIKETRANIEKSTKEKERQNLSEEKEQYAESSKKYYETKQKVIDENLKESKSELSKSKEDKSKLNVKEKERKYNQLVEQKAPEEQIDEAYYEWQVAKMQEEELTLKIAEYEEKINEMNAEKEKVSEEASKVGTSEDPEYQAYEERLQALDASKEEEVDVNASADELEKQWDTEGILEKLTVDGDTYKAFIDKYFYNEENITNGTGDNKLVLAQTETDRVMRERKQLLVNTSAHLLQVTASLRREIPIRSNQVKEMFDGVRSTDSEFQAVGYYSSTRIENARALLMYAKLLSAKLQYMAAKDLLVIDAHRTPMSDEDFSKFNLTKYKLTDTYVNNIKEESNKSVNLHEISVEK